MIMLRGDVCVYVCINQTASTTINMRYLNEIRILSQKMSSSLAGVVIFGVGITYFAPNASSSIMNEISEWIDVH